jgi:hypothetical protein
VKTRSDGRSSCHPHLAGAAGRGHAPLVVQAMPGGGGEEDVRRTGDAGGDGERGDGWLKTPPIDAPTASMTPHVEPRMAFGGVVDETRQGDEREPVAEVGDDLATNSSRRSRLSRRSSSTASPDDVGASAYDFVA